MAFGTKPWWQTPSFGFKPWMLPPNMASGSGSLPGVSMPGQPVVAGSRPQFDPFKPYKPPPIPTGSYDPALDAQLGAAQRGYGDLRQDVATADLRAQNDYGIAQEDVTRSRDRGYQDIDRQVFMLDRGYQQLARRQAEGARQRGVLSGGLALQAAQKRMENEAIDRQPLDTARARLGEDATNQLGALKLQFDRGGTDRGTALERAGRENTQFGLDTETQKAFQAAQAGYEAPGKGEKGGMPKREGVNAKGVPYRERRVGGFIYRYDRSGNVLSKRKAKK